MRRVNPTYQGKPCPKGHPGIRYRANGSCKHCLQERTAEARRQTRAKPLADPITTKRKQLFHFAQRRAMADDVPFSITLADVQIPPTCPALDIPMTSAVLTCISIGLGYVPGNVAVISSRAYNVRHGASSRELRLVADWIDRNNWLD